MGTSGVARGTAPLATTAPAGVATVGVCETAALTGATVVGVWATTASTGATVGGAFNLVNLDGVSASVPFSTGPWGATSAWPYSDVAGHGATARIRNFPTETDYRHHRHDGSQGRHRSHRPGWSRRSRRSR